MAGLTFVMAGGGTGGHVIPAVAVARELKARGHRAVFVGTRTGFEARLVPAAGFEIEWIEIGGLKSVGMRRMLRTCSQMPGSLARVSKLLAKLRPAAIFSMGGYAAGPVVVAGLCRRTPIVIMEPNAMPGLTNRMIARFVTRALLSFPETARWFPADRIQMSGLPVRSEFFHVEPRSPGERLTILVTGGSRGSRTLNNAVRESWPLLRDSALAVRLIHQTGTDAYDDIARDFADTGIEGTVCAFIDDMPAAFGQADIVVCRSGAGTVAELAAAGKPSILVPFPFATDDHQRKNAEAMAHAGAARLVTDAEMNGRRFLEEIRSFSQRPEQIREMGDKARALAHPDAAAKAAEALEEAAVTRC